MIRMVAGIVLGVLIGAGCRWFDVPVPAPPKLIGAILVVAMTVGYLGTDRLMSQRQATAAQQSAASAEISSPKR
jgi:XapX domain-containing protein